MCEENEDKESIPCGGSGQVVRRRKRSPLSPHLPITPLDKALEKLAQTPEFWEKEGDNPTSIGCYRKSNNWVGGREGGRQRQ